MSTLIRAISLYGSCVLACLDLALALARHALYTLALSVPNLALFAEDSHAAIRLTPIAMANQVGRARQLVLLAANGC